MAEDDYDDYDDYYDDGDNYIWVEDGYDLADDLAELVVPDPPAGSYEEDWDDLTRFEFWYDIEYDSDGYHDRKPRSRKRKVATQPPTVQRGKKRRADDDYSAPSKRLKSNEHANSGIVHLPPVLFVPKASPQIEEEVDLNELEAFAILPDWRERFKHVRALPALQTADDLDSTPTTLADDENEEMDDTIPEHSAEIEGLKLALEANLSSLGLDGAKIDQSLLLRLAESMMAQSDEAEKLMTELIEGVHAEKEGEDEADSFSKWVSSSATKSVNEKHEDSQIGQVDESDDGIAQGQRPALVENHNSTPHSSKTPGSFGKKRRHESPSKPKPNERKQVADKLSA